MTAVAPIFATWLLPVALTVALTLGPSAPRPDAGADSGDGREPAGETGDQPAASEADEITVTASGLEAPLAESLAAVSVLGDAELEASAAIALDDTLRRVPGFTLFRRSGSRSANPTTQGASLRGLGGSAAGRALVLADGIPLSDPFGGWVAWGSVPRMAVGRVEIVRGGTSDLYGSSALAGVVHLLRREPSGRQLLAEASVGEQATREASAWASLGREAGDGRWTGAVAADLLSTDGFTPVAADERGAVDAPAGVEHQTFEGTVTWRAAPGEAAAGGAERVFLRASWLAEDRTNGTEIQTNDTRSARLALGTDGRTGAGSYSLRAWAADQSFHQVFSAVSSDRESERRVREQTVPADETGLSARFVRSLGSTEAPQTLVTGLDLRRVKGASAETVFLPTRELSVETGGEQLLGGLFAEDLVRISERISAQLALRYDRWSNEDGFRGAQGEVERLPDRDEEAWSPRIALRYRATRTWSLTASAYRSFRAPTLNELYRGFRVGDVVTEANESLTAERLSGAEASAVWAPGWRWRLRGTLFWMELEDAIANVTLEVAPERILRRRQNLGRTRSRGIELEASGRVIRSLRVDAGYLWTDSAVTRFPAEPGLEGRRTAQVPEHQASLGLGWRAPHDVTVDLRARWTDSAFDDDQNLFPLGGLTVVDLRVGRPMGERIEVFVAAENLLDDTYASGRTPVTTVGSPRLARIGLRYRLRR